jgi:hypothetical protein
MKVSPSENMRKAKIMTNVLVAVLVIAGILVITYFVVASRTDTFTGRWVAWKSSGVDDHLLFPFAPVKRSPAAFTFMDGKEDFPVKEITYEFKGKPQTANLEALLEQTGTTAFIVIKDDAILYEN